MSMLIVAETGDLWSLGRFCRSEYVKPFLAKANATNQAMYGRGPHDGAGWWMTYTRQHGMTWCICIESDGRVSFLAPCDESKKADPCVDSRYNTRAGVMALGRLPGILLGILRRPGPASLPEVSFDPGSPAFGRVFRHMTQNPRILRAFQREGLYLVALSGEAIRFRRYSRRHNGEG